MAYYIKHENDELLPEWLKSNISSSCPACGAYMMNYYNDYEQCTNRRCSNKYCPAMLAKRAVGMFTILGLKGVGYETALKVIRNNKLKSHVDVIGFILDDILTIPLHKFLRLMEFERVDTAWEHICMEGDYYTLDDLFSRYNGEYKYVLNDNQSELYRCATFFNFSKPKVKKVANEPIQTLRIMITGTPVGYATKESYVETLNMKLQGIIKIIHVPHARKTNVDALIRESGSTTKGKYTAALEAGIPILTSEEFNAVLTYIIEEEVNRINKRKESDAHEDY